MLNAYVKFIKKSQCPFQLVLMLINTISQNSENTSFVLTDTVCQIIQPEEYINK